MQTRYGHLTYCSNIHPGVSWEEHFRELKENLPYIRREVAGDEPLAIGLRCAHEASLELSRPARLQEFRQWLDDNRLYIFCINGFPYGSFHGSVVKDQVHSPDWTTGERAAYTKRLFKILAGLLPDGMHGGVSTPPLSYRHWWATEEQRQEAVRTATANILDVVAFLIDLEAATGRFLHLDIEPEPDGILDNGHDFFEWYEHQLIPAAVAYLEEKKGYGEEESGNAVRRYVQLCYDVCHFAVSYESPAAVMEKLRQTGIRVGRLQVSSALRVDLSDRKEEKLEALAAFNEPVYLHQVVARKAGASPLLHYTDLDKALSDDTSGHAEWRVHFHVPLFLESYGLLNSTQPDIKEVLAIQKNEAFTDYLEVETYTWGVLPAPLHVPVSDSIVRELTWVKKQLDTDGNE
ncbi:MAG: xylose isomerase [Cytophagaceae bacterium SCN 52-12]|nr:MAG: xylose isomerase [Cytophagaceae bacterium SCN 52-12]